MNFLMSEMIIKEKRFIAARSLKQGFEKEILSELSEDLENLTRKERGIVTKIISVRAQLGNVSRKTGSVAVDLEMTAICYLPEAGNGVLATVTRPLAIGVLCSYLGINIWIGADDMRGMVYDENTDGYVTDDSDIQIVQGSEVNVIITTVRYNKGEFSCIAFLPENEN